MVKSRRIVIFRYVVVSSVCFVKMLFFFSVGVGGEFVLCEREERRVEEFYLIRIIIIDFMLGVDTRDRR